MHNVISIVWQIDSEIDKVDMIKIETYLEQIISRFLVVVGANFLNIILIG